MYEFAMQPHYSPFVFKPNKQRALCEMRVDTRLHRTRVGSNNTKKNDDSDCGSNGFNSSNNSIYNNKKLPNRNFNSSNIITNENDSYHLRKELQNENYDNQNINRCKVVNSHRDRALISYMNKKVDCPSESNNNSSYMNNGANHTLHEEHLPSVNGAESVYAYGGEEVLRELTMHRPKIYNDLHKERNPNNARPPSHVLESEKSKMERERRWQSQHTCTKEQLNDQSHINNIDNLQSRNDKRMLSEHRSRILSGVSNRWNELVSRLAPNNSLEAKNKDIAKVLHTKLSINAKASSRTKNNDNTINKSINVVNKKVAMRVKNDNNESNVHRRSRNEQELLKETYSQRTRKLLHSTSTEEKEQTIPTLPSLNSMTKYGHANRKCNLRTSSKLLSFCHDNSTGSKGKESTSTCGEVCEGLTSSPASMGLSNGVSSSSTNTIANECKLHTNPPSPMRILYHLNSYEEEEIREYLPHVYFTGHENCKKINASRSLSNNDGFDDEKSHYIVALGDHIAYRYEILRELGKGTFGVVVCAHDHKRNRLVAVKIIKNKPSYLRQAEEEVKLLAMMRNDDPYDQANIVRMLSSFMFRRHYVIVFELLKQDVYNLCQVLKFKPFPITFIAHFARQVLVALQFVRQHRIIHCDIKPENIVFVQDVHSDDRLLSEPFHIKLIDFGSACLESRQLYTYIQSRYYRAPEIVLGIPYTPAIDMWSFGCVLCELANGYPIFPAATEMELLERIFEYLGPCPLYLQQQGKRALKFYSDDGSFRADVLQSSKGNRRLANARSVRAFVQHAPGTEQERLYFVDFIARCLVYDPAQRMTPLEGLQHPWLCNIHHDYALPTFIKQVVEGEITDSEIRRNGRNRINNIEENVINLVPKE